MKRCHDSWVETGTGLRVWSIWIMYFWYSSYSDIALAKASKNNSRSAHCEIRWEKLIFMVMVVMHYWGRIGNNENPRV